MACWRQERASQIAQVFEAEDAGIVAVREMKVQGISADDGNVSEGQIIRNAFVLEDPFTGPFVHTACAGARPPEAWSSITRFSLVRPFDRQFAVRFLEYL